MATKNFSIVWSPGETIALTIRRKSDNYYWTGSAWQAGSATVNMTEASGLATGYSEYHSDTAPDAPCFWWALDSNSNLAGRGEYDPSQTTAATSSDIAPTTADLKEFLQIPSADTGDDAFLGNCSNRAGDYVETYCQRRFDSSSRTYVVNGTGTGRMFLPDWPITTVTSIYGPCSHFPRHFSATGGSVVATELVDSDYYIIGNIGGPNESKNHIIAIASGSAVSGILGIWDYGVQNYQVVATTGYAALPADLYNAALEVAAYFYHQGKSGRLGTLSKTVNGGSLSYEFEHGIPLHTKHILERYKRWTI